MRWKILIATICVSLCGCAKPAEYLRSQEVRVVCHQKYSKGSWHPTEVEGPLVILYQQHIGWHPNDYWGRCEDGRIDQ